MSDTDAEPDASAASDGGSGWFEVPPIDGGAETESDDAATAAAAARVRDGSADSPADWPTLAVGSGAAGSTDDYYDRLKAAATRATREAVRERERADDAQLIHAIRAMDDRRRILT